jgi:hypothetical protein
VNAVRKGTYEGSTGREGAAETEEFLKRSRRSIGRSSITNKR